MRRLPQDEALEQRKLEIAEKRRLNGKLGGRPKGSGLIYKPEDWVDRVCDWISSGKTLTKFSEQEGCPDRNTVYNWKDEHEWFAERLACARCRGEEAILDEVTEIADEEGQDPNRAKVRVWTRMELLKMWNPARWAEQKKLAVSGSIGLEALVAGAAEQAKELPAIKEKQQYGGHKKLKREHARLLAAQSSTHVD